MKKSLIKYFIENKNPFIKILIGLIIFFAIISIAKLGYQFGQSLNK